MAQLQDQRQFLRYPREMEVECQMDDARFPARTRNISSGGISLVFDRRMRGDFTVALPVELGHQERTVAVVHHREEAGKTTIGGSFTEPLPDESLIASAVLSRKPLILVVEEEDGIRKLLRDGLEIYNINVWPVAGGLDAVAVYRRHHDCIALVLIEVEMRGMDGPWTLAGLRQVNSGIGCWFMTGEATAYPNEVLLGMGAARVLVRPFKLTQLASELKAVCEAWQG